VIKFHVFQHFGELVSLHGPAFLWDAFGFERMLGILKRDVTTTRHYLTQIGRNFLLRYFADPFLKRHQLDSSVQGFLKRLNVDHLDSSLSDLSIAPLVWLEKDASTFPTGVYEAFLKTALKRWQNTTRADFHAWQKQRVTRLHWYERTYLFSVYILFLLHCVQCCRHHMTITSTQFHHRGKTDDSYLHVKDGVFGQVEDIVFIPDKDAAILFLRIFTRQNINGGNGLPILFPINQFPVEATNNYRTVVLNSKAYVQKIIRSDLTFKRDSNVSTSYPFFSIRPNPWFRF
jgi:hypothetical protein